MKKNIVSIIVVVAVIVGLLAVVVECWSYMNHAQPTKEQLIESSIMKKEVTGQFGIFETTEKEEYLKFLENIGLENVVDISMPVASNGASVYYHMYVVTYRMPSR